MKQRGYILMIVLMVFILLTISFVLAQKESYTNSTIDKIKISDAVTNNEKEGISQVTASNCDSYSVECQSGREDACLKYDFNCNSKFESPKENLEIKEGKVIYEGVEVKSSPSEIIKEVNDKFGSADKVDLIKEKEEVKYEVISQKEGKVIGIFDINYKVKYIFDKGGNYEGKEKPWWQFLVIEKPRKIKGEIKVGDCITSQISKGVGEVNIFVELKNNTLYFEHNLSTYCNFADIVTLESEIIGNTLKITEKIKAGSPLVKCICLIPVNGTINLPDGTNISRVNITLLNEVVNEEIFLGSAFIENNNLGSQGCQKLIYQGNPKTKINVLFISNHSNETYVNDILFDFFNKGNNVSFYSIYPFNETESLFNFYSINIYNLSTQYSSTEDLLLGECPDLSPFIYQILLLNDEDFLPWESNPIALGGYLSSTNRLYKQYIVSPERTSLAIFLHEFGHSFFGFNEGYGVGFGERGFDSIEYYKENYNKGAGYPNWDIEGCPKWCSGQINSSSICYPEYTILKNCLLSAQTDTNEKANFCVSSFFDNLSTNLGLGQPLDCKLGINCSDNSNCWFIGNGFFRPNAMDIMFGGNDLSMKLPTYGPFREHMMEIINLINQSVDNNNLYNFTIASLSLILNDKNAFFFIKFNGINEDGHSLTFFNNVYLGNNMVVNYEIEVPNTSNKFVGNITSFIKIDTNGTYSGESSYISMKDLTFPLTINLTFYYPLQGEIQKGQEFSYLVNNFGEIE